jgi:hypothetical protein
LSPANFLGLQRLPSLLRLSASDQARDGLLDHRLHLPGRHLDRQRSALAVSNQVELRSKPAAAAAQRVVGRLVRVTLETSLSAPAAARAA